MSVLACGNCGGALDVTEKQSIIKCNYCGYSNELTNLENDLQEFKGEVETWLANLGAVGGAGMDVIMRQIYLRDNIYPALCTEFSNLVGDTEDIMDFPLAYLHIYSKIPDLTIHTNWNAQMGVPLKEFARKLESPELSAFASDPESLRLIHELKLRALLTPMLMDLVELGSSPNPDSFRRGAATLEYISTQIEPLINISADDQPSKDMQKYYKLLHERFKMNAEALHTFAASIESGSSIDEDWVSLITKKIIEMKSDLHNTKSVSVIDRVLLDAGLDNDRSALTANYSIVSQYHKITKIPFNKYLDAISRFSERSLFKTPGESKIDISWFTYSMSAEKFSWFLSILQKTLTEESVQIMADSTMIKKGTSKSRADASFFLYPFYLLKVTAILKSGFLLWKKGDEEIFFSLCDATFNTSPNFNAGDFPSLMTKGFKKMIGSKQETQIKTLMKTHEQPIPEGWILLPPTVTPENACQIYNAAHNLLEEAEFSKLEGRPVQIPPSYKSKGFDAGKVKSLSAEVQKLVYVPMIIEQGHARILGKHLTLDESLPHRIDLGASMSVFLNEIESNS